MKPLIICAAVTGGAPAKAKTPHHPTTPREVVDSAVACWRAGASVIHYHARLEDGSTTMDVDAYRDIADRIRATGCDAILNLSAGDNGGRANHEQRLNVTDVGAEIVSLDVGSFNIANRIYDNSPTYLRAMSERMRRKNIVPEIEVFDVGNLTEVLGLIAAVAVVAPDVEVHAIVAAAENMPDGAAQRLRGSNQPQTLGRADHVDLPDQRRSGESRGPARSRQVDLEGIGRRSVRGEDRPRQHSGFQRPRHAAPSRALKVRMRLHVDRREAEDRQQHDRQHIAGFPRPGCGAGGGDQHHHRRSRRGHLLPRGARLLDRG